MADELKHAYRDRWVRFHSLPGSKRYPDTADEYSIVLDRYNTVLDELFTGQEVYLITCGWSNRPEPDAPPVDHAQWLGARYWTSVCNDPTETDAEFISYTHLFVSRIPWQRGAVDDLLRVVANDATRGVMITDLSLERIHHPYDGGTDVLLPTPAERDTLMHQHAHWLSQHPEGF
ncbi:DUF3885 domain-containing protein [Nocardia jinanensis]|uniref:DUF3885 domain-containing protein n=1 Tax=Nocardia jinanensis TaxID=382504 RepID=A0A917RKT5_9NOCA|nr:hypothetical protein [Nocardia jinanensis]GGL11227.1 hypothetical protein GCM10011588_27150 [Nocardia jinanensis]